MSALDPRTPVLVGVGQVVVRDGEPLEPLGLMDEAARAAAADAGASGLLVRAQSVAVVDSISAPMGDPAAALAARIGARPQETVTSGLGGNGPQLLVNDLCSQIAAGGLDVALIAGAEAMATVTRLMKRGEEPPWKREPNGARPTRTLGDERPGSSAAEDAAGLIAPIFFYPVLEHALRGTAGRERDAHVEHISALWAGFSRVAAGNEHAWSRHAYDARELADASEANRKVSDPYLKLHNSHIGVDMGAALLLCSAQAAEAAGVPRDRWVFPHAGAQANDHWHVTERDELHRSPALRLAGAAALEHAGVGAADLAHLDLYSCFPSAVQIAAHELGIDLDPSRPPTQTGGLTFAGGPGNNYSTHAIAALADTLRADPQATGLATALGWYATKHALGVYSCRPPSRPYAAIDVQGQVDELPRRELAEGYAGGGTVESYTALYERDGSPGMGIVVARLADGRRAAAKSHEPDALAELIGGEDPLGRALRLTAPEGFQLT